MSVLLTVASLSGLSGAFALRNVVVVNKKGLVHVRTLLQRMEGKTALALVKKQGPAILRTVCSLVRALLTVLNQVTSPPPAPQARAQALLQLMVAGPNGVRLAPAH